jgi:phage terminase small subunit
MDTVTLSPEFKRLVEMTETNLHLIVKFENLTREDAIAIKEAMNRPLGHLSRRFGLRPVRTKHLTVTTIKV